MEDVSEVKNCSAMHIIKIQNLSVMQFHPLPNGEGKPTEVHVAIGLDDFPGTLVMRLKSKEAVNDLISALAKHRDEVFGGGNEQPV